MGELVMTKNEGRLEFLDESIRFMAESGGILKAEEFVLKEQQAHPGMDTTSCYHKIVMARYFGLVLFNNYSSYYFLTESGTVYSRATTKESKIDAILKALTSVTFGRNNNAVNSNSDIEAPVVMLKAIFLMGSASMTQIGLILYYMDAHGKTLYEAIDEVIACENQSELRRKLTETQNSKYFDVKFNKLFFELGIVEKEQGNYVLSKYVRDKHLDFINALPELKPIISKNKKNPEDINDADYNDIFFHNVYGIHIKKGNDALSEDRPHICIGWSKMGDVSSAKSRTELNGMYDNTWPEANPRAKGQDVGQIWRFISEMQVGDYVIFADGDVCHIGRIDSDYYFDANTYENQDADYVNTRKVKWLKKNILRSDLSVGFHRSLMTAMSVWTLNDYKSAVYDLLMGRYVKDDVLLGEIEEGDIFPGFASWLVSENNPDYTGTEKYNGYSEALEKLVKYMAEKDLIEDANLNEKDVEKYNGILEVYNDSDDAQEYDKVNVHHKRGAAALKKYIKYIKYLTTPHAEKYDYSATKGHAINKVFYGVPGCGKSYHIQHNILGNTTYIRTTFYQDYSNADFVGQILPKIVKGETGEKDTVEYIFNPGPFTLALIQAISNPTEKVALIIEEINRGNAPAIFGDIFQLLDRDDDSISEYGIKNVGMIDHLNAYEFTVGGEKKHYHFDEIKIPGNLDIYATMNTSDQNVYTLDTAFTRRWSKEHIPNVFNGHKIEKMYVPGMSNYTWGAFVDSINNQIRENLESLQVNEDKQVGAFFVKEKDLLENSADSTQQKAKMFAYKVLEYLWADVSKLDHQVIFNPKYTTFEAVVTDFANGIIVFNDKLGFKTASTAPVAEE